MMANKPTRRVVQKEPPKLQGRVRIVCISDTHELHRELTLPDGNLLIHAGDFTVFNSTAQIRDFNLWLGALPLATKLSFPGTMTVLSTRTRACAP